MTWEATVRPSGRHILDNRARGETKVAPVSDTEDWRDQAACRQEDPDLFFPVGTTGPALGQIEQAKAICRGCPVIEDCLRFALDTGQDYGIWGGLTENERRTLRRRTRRRLSPAAPPAGARTEA